MSDHGLRGEIVTCSTPTYDGITRTPSAPRVLARITEEDSQTYGYRCESCAYRTDPGDECEYLELVAKWAHDHATATGHAVLVEAL